MNLTITNITRVLVVLCGSVIFGLLFSYSFGVTALYFSPAYINNFDDIFFIGTSAGWIIGSCLGSCLSLFIYNLFFNIKNKLIYLLLIAWAIALVWIVLFKGAFSGFLPIILSIIFIYCASLPGLRRETNTKLPSSQDSNSFRVRISLMRILASLFGSILLGYILTFITDLSIKEFLPIVALKNNPFYGINITHWIIGICFGCCFAVYFVNLYFGIKNRLTYLLIVAGAMVIISTQIFNIFGSHALVIILPLSLLVFIVGCDPYAFITGNKRNIELIAEQPKYQVIDILSRLYIIFLGAIMFGLLASIIGSTIHTNTGYVNSWIGWVFGVCFGGGAAAYAYDIYCKIKGTLIKWLLIILLLIAIWLLIIKFYPILMIYIPYISAVFITGIGGPIFSRYAQNHKTNII